MNKSDLIELDLTHNPTVPLYTHSHVFRFFFFVSKRPFLQIRLADLSLSLFLSVSFNSICMLFSRGSPVGWQKKKMTINNNKIISINKRTRDVLIIIIIINPVISLFKTNDKITNKLTKKKKKTSKNTRPVEILIFSTTRKRMREMRWL